MTSRTKLKKFGTLALGALCVYLVFKLFYEISASPAEAARGNATMPQTSSLSSNSAKPLRKEIGKLASVDPHLEIQTLKQFVTRPLPGNLRDPFDFGAPPPAPMSPGRGGAAGGPGGAGGPGVSSAPPPPQIPLRAIGYSLRVGVGGEAYLADNDQVFIVHQGDTVSKQYTILRVTTATVEVRDESSGQTVQLPIPDAQ